MKKIKFLNELIVRFLAILVFLVNVAHAPIGQAQDFDPESLMNNPLVSALGDMINNNPQMQLDENDFKQIKREGNTFLVPQGIKQKSLFNLNALASHAKVRKALAKDKTVGFQITQLSPRGLFAYLGFQVGDLVQKVNGHKVSSEDQAQELIQKLAFAQEFWVDLERGSQQNSMTLNYKLVG
jgi:hypothetical protein